MICLQFLLLLVSKICIEGSLSCKSAFFGPSFFGWYLLLFYVVIQVETKSCSLVQYHSACSCMWRCEAIECCWLLSPITRGKLSKKCHQVHFWKPEKCTVLVNKKLAVADDLTVFQGTWILVLSWSLIRSVILSKLSIFEFQVPHQPLDLTHFSIIPSYSGCLGLSLFFSFL